MELKVFSITIILILLFLLFFSLFHLIPFFSSFIRLTSAEVTLRHNDTLRLFSAHPHAPKDYISKLSLVDFVALEDMLLFLKPFMSLSILCEGEKYITISHVYPRLQVEKGAIDKLYEQAGQQSLFNGTAYYFFYISFDTFIKRGPTKKCKNRSMVRRVISSPVDVLHGTLYAR